MFVIPYTNLRNPTFEAVGLGAGDIGFWQYDRVQHRGLQKLGPSSKIQLGSQQTNFLKTEKISEKNLNP